MNLQDPANGYEEMKENIEEFKAIKKKKRRGIFSSIRMYAVKFILRWRTSVLKNPSKYEGRGEVRGFLVQLRDHLD